jgi:hypothetical protein
MAPCGTRWPRYVCGCGSPACGALHVAVIARAILASGAKIVHDAQIRPRIWSFFRLSRLCPATLRLLLSLKPRLCILNPKSWLAPLVPLQALLGNVSPGPRRIAARNVLRRRRCGMCVCVCVHIYIPHTPALHHVPARRAWAGVYVYVCVCVRMM